MDDKSPAPGCSHRLDEGPEEGVVVPVINPDAGFDGDGNIGFLAHGDNALGYYVRTRHQARSELTALDTVTRAAHIDIDLVVVVAGGLRRRFCHPGGIATTQLQRKRMFFRIEVQEAIGVTVHNRRRRDHLRIQKRGWA